MNKTQRVRYLVVDDDAGALVYLLRQIERECGTECQIVGSLTEGLREIYGASDWAGAVFDLFLPSDELRGVFGNSAQIEALTAETGGLLLASAFQDRFPGRPMIVWSMWGPEPGPLQPFVDAGVCRFFDKHKLPNSDTKELGTFLVQSPKPNSVLQIAWDSMLAQPNIGGLGIDLKKTLEDFRKRYSR